MPGASRPPALLLPECLCLDDGGGPASLQHGDQGLRVRGQQASLLLWDRLGYVEGWADGRDRLGYMVGVGQVAGVEPIKTSREG